MICDGDSKSYGAVWNYYGVCDLCYKNKELHKSPKKYEQWQKTEEYKEWDNSHLTGAADCNRVIKRDCIGHVQKRKHDVMVKTGIGVGTFTKKGSKKRD